MFTHGIGYIAKMKKIYLAAVAGNLGMLSIGQFIGWTSPSLPKLMDSNSIDSSVHLTSDEVSWIAALYPVGAIVGPIICKFIVNIIGRKHTMLLATLPGVISWIMIAFATSAWELYIARILCGLSTGMSYTTTPMYLGEISPANIRGYLVSMLVVVSSIGTLIEYCIGPFLSVQNLALVSLVAPCLFVVTFIWLPESPYHLMRCNAREKAINSLVQLRGKKDVYTEANNIEQAVKIDLANETGFREILFVRGNRRALIIVLCLAVFQQTSGISAILQFAEIIFDEANSGLEGKYLTMILGGVQLVCTAVCMFVIDLSGRKPLLMISAFGSACSTAMVGIYFNLQYNNVNTSNLVWLPVTGVLMYMIMYSVGLAALVLTICSEVFPTNVKALGATLTVILLGVSGAVVGKFYLLIAESVGTHVPFYIFSASGLACVLYTFFCVPETKGKTLEEIQEKLHKQPRDTRKMQPDVATC